MAIVGFTKLFSSIVTSTIWSEDSDTRVVFVTLLALADRRGVVHGSIPGIARIAGVPLDVCARAIQKFKAPDPYSRSKEHEGRRLEDVDGGWVLLNYAKYRAMRDEEERRLQNQENAKRSRSKNSAYKSDCQPRSAQAEADTEADTEKTKERVVFDYWAKTMGHQRAIFDQKRQRRISDRLKEGFTVEQLCKGIEGATRNDWIMGRDPKSKTKYDGIETILRDAAQVEKMIELAKSKRTLTAAEREAIRERQRAACRAKPVQNGPQVPPDGNVARVPVEARQLVSDLARQLEVK